MEDFKNKIYRINQNKSIAGVAAGLAESFEMDLTAVRLIFVLSSIFLGGVGLIVYVVIWAVAPIKDPYLKFTKNPSNPFDKDYPKERKVVNDHLSSNFQNPIFEPKPRYPKSPSAGKLIGGVVLIVIGLSALFDNFNIFNVWYYMYKFWPLGLILIGVLILMRYFKPQPKVEDIFATPSTAETVSENPSENEKNDNESSTIIENNDEK